MQSTRRNEVRPTPVSYAPGAVGRNLLSPPDGNPEASWITQGVSSEPTSAQRHGFPYTIVASGVRQNRASTWDNPLNVLALESQIVTSSAGRGASDPQRAGSDLAARIWSVKRWSVTGDLFGQSIDESVATGSALSVSKSTSSESSSETPYGTVIGRQFLPTSVAYSVFLLSEEEEDDSLTSFTFSLTWPDALVSSAWSSRRQLAAGMSGGLPVICPALRGQLNWSINDEGGDSVSSGSIQFRPERVTGGGSPDLWDIVVAPVKLCGYDLRGSQSPTTAGTIDGSITIRAAEFWGPEEWPA